MWSLPLAIDPVAGEAAAASLVEHTAELGCQAAPGNISALDAYGELFVVSYSRGVILELVGPATRPSTPSGVRIIRGSS